MITSAVTQNVYDDYKHPVRNVLCGLRLSVEETNNYKNAVDFWANLYHSSKKDDFITHVIPQKP